MKPDHKLTTGQIVDLLKKEKEEEENLRASIRSTMNIYITILVAIMGATATLISTRSSSLGSPWLGAVLLLAGTLVLIIAYVGEKHYFSDYRRQAESIVQQAKLEDLLGMDDPDVYPLSGYWKGESLLPQSFVQSRSRFEHSQDFVNWFVKATDYKIAKVLYRAFMAAGIALIIISILAFCGVV